MRTRTLLAGILLGLSAALRAAPPPAVAVLAHEPGYYTSLAKHCVRWLRDEGIAARLADPSGAKDALAGARLAFLVGYANPNERELSALRAFRARGGKLVVFHSASPGLAQLMGVRSLGYAKAPYPGAFSRMDFVAKAVPAGCPGSVLQTSTVLLRAAPEKGRGRVMATWSDRRGRSTGEAAWIATDAGWWMTHVLLADGDERLKAQLLGALCGAAAPGSWSAAAHAARERARADALRTYAARQTARPGEIRAVWEHSGCGLYPGNWPKTIARLRQAHVTDLFVNVAGAGFAHYASSVLPRSATFRREGDQLAACLKAAAGSGIRVHAWILCFSATRAEPETLDLFRRRGWRLKAGGKCTEYLDPSLPEVRSHVLAAVSEISDRYAVAGVHLDFVRWYERAAKPKDAAACVTRFVSDARARVKRPKLLSAAVFGKYPSCVATVGQDWASWIDAGHVDYAVPMDYTEDLAKFRGFAAQHAQGRGRAARTIAGIGVTANESRLDARQVIDQVNAARAAGLAGTALFDLDVTLEKDILPYLNLGLW